MRGVVAKLIRKVYPDKLEARAFRDSYNHASAGKKTEARKVSRKIAQFRKEGKEVRLFRINPETNAIERIEDAGTVEYSENSSSSSSD